MHFRKVYFKVSFFFSKKKIFFSRLCQSSHVRLLTASLPSISQPFTAGPTSPETWRSRNQLQKFFLHVQHKFNNFTVIKPSIQPYHESSAGFLSTRLTFPLLLYPLGTFHPYSYTLGVWKVYLMLHLKDVGMLNHSFLKSREGSVKPPSKVH